MVVDIISSTVWLFVLWLHTLCAADQEGNLRLVGGKLSSEGRVEVYHEGRWGTVCDDSWDMAEAQVVCRQLRYPGALSAVQGGTYGQGSGPIWLDDLSCEGAESRLSGCKFKGWGVTDCSHSEDAGVVCERNSLLDNNQVYALDDSLSLGEDLERLFSQGLGCDLNVTVQSPDGEETFCLHSLVLSMSLKPSTFESFRGQLGLGINVTQTCRPHISDFFRYLYTRKIDVTVSSVLCVHQLATNFGMKWLQEGAGRLFSWLLPGDPTFKSQVALYDYAVQAGDEVLQETCLQYLAWNCKALINSPVWSNLSRKTVDALLSRSDVVVPDEAFLLSGLESWILKQNSTHDAECVTSLLSLVRFPMISAEKLYDLQFSSGLYARYKDVYSDAILWGFQFNTVSFLMLKKHRHGDSNEYIPRIYTASPWSLMVNINDTLSTYQHDRNYRYNPYGGYYGGRYSRIRSFETPRHNSMLFKSEKMDWSANIFLTQQECLNSGFQCESVPAVWLGQSRVFQNQNMTRFNNRLLLTCDGDYIFHIQDFKNNLALAPLNSTTGQTYPCNSEHYEFHFVVRPQYE